MKRAAAWHRAGLLALVAASVGPACSETDSDGAAGNGAGAAAGSSNSGSSAAAAAGGNAGETAGGATACDGSVGCGLELLCASQPCGSAVSRFEADGCVRRLCTAQSDCPTGTTCLVPSMLSAGCTPSEVEGCSTEEGACACSMSADCSPAGQCVLDEIVPLVRCPVPEDCDEVRGKAARLEDSAAALDGELEGEVSACLSLHEARALELGCRD